MKRETDDRKQTERPRYSFQRSEKIYFAVMSGLCLLGLLVLYRGHPTGYSFMPRCPFYLATGLYCPGCGSLRATHYFLHGNFSASFRHHPLFLPLLACILFLLGKRLYEFRFETELAFRGELLVYKIILAVFVLFFIARNIPLSALEWARPPEPTVTTIQRGASEFGCEFGQNSSPKRSGTPRSEG